MNCMKEKGIMCVQLSSAHIAARQPKSSIETPAKALTIHLIEAFQPAVNSAI